MKIEQKPKFQPITIIIETAEEAEALWACVDGREVKGYQKSVCNELSNWFCQHAQLIGTP